MLFLYVNVPFANENYYFNDFHQVVINPNKNIDFSKINFGINIIKTNINVFPVRVAVESKISEIAEYKNFLITLSSGIKLGNNFNFELGANTHLNDILTGKMKPNWMFGFNIMVF